MTELLQVDSIEFTDRAVGRSSNSDGPLSRWSAGQQARQVRRNQPVSLGAGLKDWADSPDNGPHDFGGRLIVTFLFPK